MTAVILTNITFSKCTSTPDHTQLGINQVRGATFDTCQDSKTLSPETVTVRPEHRVNRPRRKAPITKDMTPAGATRDLNPLAFAQIPGMIPLHYWGSFETPPPALNLYRNVLRNDVLYPNTQGILSLSKISKRLDYIVATSASNL